MAEWIPLNRSEHAGWHWFPRAGYGFARSQEVVDVLITEIAEMLPHYVFAFMLDENEQPKLVALLGLGEGLNLYTNADNLWLCDYPPALLRGYPLRLLREDNSEEKILCIEKSHLSEKEKDESQLLLQNNGEPSEHTKAALDFLNFCEREKNRTKTACDELDSAELLEPWPLVVNSGDGSEQRSLSGLLKISESALNSLDENRLAKVRDSGGLVLAYAQLFSMLGLKNLSKRAEFLVVENEKREQLQSEFSDLFTDSGGLNFDSIDTDKL